MPRPTHIIHRQHIELHLTAPEHAHEWERRVYRFCREEMPRQLEAVFSAVAGEQKVLRLDRLEIDLGIIPPGQLETEWGQRVVEKVKEALSHRMQELPAKASRNGAEIKTAGESRLEAFIYFLRNGTLPWWAGSSGRREWTNEIPTLIQAHPELAEKIRRELTAHTVSMERLLLQFEEAFYLELLHSILPPQWRTVVDAWQEITDVIMEPILPGSWNSGTKRWRWRAFFQGLHLFHTSPDPAEFVRVMFYPEQVRKAWPASVIVQLGQRLTKKAVQNKLASWGVSPNEMNSLLRHWAERTPLPEVNEKVGTQEEGRLPERASPGRGLAGGEEMFFEGQGLAREQQAEEGDFIQAAGIVLLHPFLQSFFAERGLLQAKRFVDPQAKQKAMSLLYYLGSGETVVEEYKLPLIKVLCGWPATQPVEAGIPLTEEDQRAGMALLKAVAGHWKALKSSSPLALRENFLKRTGKLVLLADGNQQLIMEKRSIDILVERLPWGINLIRLPWMKNMLFVDWV